MSERSTTDRAPAVDLETLIPEARELSPKQRQLAEILRTRPELFAFGNLRTIERQLSVSSITVIRFAKRLGFSGFHGLQAVVRDSYLSRAGFTTPGEGGAAEGDSLIAATMEQQRRNLEVTQSNLSEEQLTRIATTLIGARRILAFGSGSAGIVAQLLVRLLRHVGLAGEVVELSGVDDVIAMHDVDESDVVLAVSLWLNFAATLRAFRIAKQSGASTIAIVGGHVSPLATMADQVLYAPGQGVALPFSLSGPIAMVESILSAVAAQRSDQVAEIRRRLHEQYVEEDLLASTTDVADESSQADRR